MNAELFSQTPTRDLTLQAGAALNAASPSTRAVARFAVIYRCRAALWRKAAALDGIPADAIFASFDPANPYANGINLIPQPSVP